MLYYYLAQWREPTCTHAFFLFSHNNIINNITFGTTWHSCTAGVRTPCQTAYAVGGNERSSTLYVIIILRCNVFQTEVFFFMFSKEIHAFQKRVHPYDLCCTVRCTGVVCPLFSSCFDWSISTSSRRVRSKIIDMKYHTVVCVVYTYVNNIISKYEYYVISIGCDSTKDRVRLRAPVWLYSKSVDCFLDPTVWERDVLLLMKFLYEHWNSTFILLR